MASSVPYDPYIPQQEESSQSRTAAIQAVSIFCPSQWIPLNSPIWLPRPAYCAPLFPHPRSMTQAKLTRGLPMPTSLVLLTKRLLGHHLSHDLTVKVSNPRSSVASTFYDIDNTATSAWYSVDYHDHYDGICLSWVVRFYGPRDDVCYHHDGVDCVSW